MKPCFSGKHASDEKTTLNEQTEIISDGKTIAKTLNNFFGNIVNNLNVKTTKELLQSIDTIKDYKKLKNLKSTLE